MTSSSKISERSWISVGLAASLIGGACWASLVYAQVSQSKQDISELKSQQASYAEELKQIHKQLDTIQGMLIGQRPRGN